MASSRSLAQRADRAALENARSEVAALDAMTVGELAERYREVFGVPTRTRNKEYLRKHIAWRVQAEREGGLSRRALERIEHLAPRAPARWREPIAKPSATAGGTTPSRDPRLPRAGTVLTRVHAGVEHQVTVLEAGFEYQGTCFRSLSKIAKLITGTPWNGFTFFLGRGSGRRAGGAEGGE